MEEELKHFKNSAKRQLKTANKYLAKCRLQLDRCLNHEKILHEAELIQTNLYRLKRGDRSLTAEDWLLEGKTVTLALDPKIPPHEEVAERFKEAKKLRLGLPFAQNELAKAEKRVAEAVALREALERVEKEEDLESLRSFFKEKQIPYQKQEKTPPKPFYTYVLEDGTHVFAGKTAQGNDFLTFNFAKGNDFWAHATGVPGSHVVIRPPPHQDLNQKTLEEALKVALYHSKARNGGEGEVSLTHVKHVRKAGKQKGKVQIACEKRYLIRIEKNYRPKFL